MRRAALVAGCLIAVATLIAAWNLAITRWRIARAPLPGRFYVVDGSRFYIDCVGTGSPAVVIESGFNATSLGWYGVQRTLGRLTRVCAYDRPGLGMSEPRARPRDAETVARQLHTLLDVAGVERPLVLAAWSAGALYARDYARQFPADLAGLALIDPSTPEQLSETPGFSASLHDDIREQPRQYRLDRLRVWTGWQRLRGRCTNDPGNEVVEMLSPEEAGRLTAIYVAETCRPDFIGGEYGELVDLETSFAEAGRLASFGNLPLLVLSADRERENDEMFLRQHEKLKSLSTRGWRVIARHAGHPIHHDRPDVVVKELTRLVAYIRGGPRPPFGETLVN